MRAALAAGFSLFLLAACGSDSAPDPGLRGPQVALVATDAVVIAWESEDAAPGAVEFEPVDGGAVVRVETPAANVHACALVGLVPGTRYAYRIEIDGEIVSEGHEFTTASDDLAAPVRFAVFGDSGSGTQVQREVAAAVGRFQPDLVLIAGDVIYETGAPRELDPRYFDPYRGLIDRIPFYPALGNHDVLTDNGRPLLDALHLPGNERHYSFDRGDVHFLCIDTNQDTAPGSAQYLWLETDLAASTARWTVAWFHDPPYSSSRHGSDLTQRANLGPLFDLHGVDVAFTGHDHVYERTFPMFADVAVDTVQEPDYVDPAGTIYIVTGGGGRSLYVPGISSFTAASEAAHHHLEVEIVGSVMTITAMRPTDEVLDVVTVTKS